MLRRLLSRSRFDESTHRLYDSLVAQARQPFLYASLGVPDTLDGRFEMTVLHALLAMRRLRRIEAGGAGAAQSLFDLMFADFDAALREIGVGDLKVGTRIKKMGQAFYGRATALDEALADDAQAGALEAAVRRNTFGTVEVGQDELAAFARYIVAQEQHLAGQPDEALLGGDMTFVDARSAAHD